MGFFERQRFLAAIDQVNSRNCLVLPPLDVETMTRLHQLARRHHASMAAVVAELALMALDEAEKAEPHKEFRPGLANMRSRLVQSLAWSDDTLDKVFDQSFYVNRTSAR